MYTLRYILFSKIVLHFSFTIFLLFSTLKNRPSQARRSASGVKEKCVRGQGQVRRGSRESASWVKEKCIGGQGEVLPLNVWYSAEALLLDPWCTFPWPPAHFYWSLTHFSLTLDALLLDLEGLFFRVKNSKKLVKKKSKTIFESAIYLEIFIHFIG